MSTYTGIPNISVPIYNIKYRDLTLPISLSYHAGGIKIEEEASWVGLGWSLNAGGVISRTIRGKNDLALVDGFTSRLDLRYVGYPFEGQVSNSQEILFQICEGELDGEPDQFNFNIAGYSGKFVLKPNSDLNQNYIEGILLDKNQAILIRFNIVYWNRNIRNSSIC